MERFCSHEKQVIWASFPEIVSLQGQNAVEKTTIDMLKSAALGDDFFLRMGEDFPSPMHALVMKDKGYPIHLD